MAGNEGAVVRHRVLFEPLVEDASRYQVRADRTHKSDSGRVVAQDTDSVTGSQVEHDEGTSSVAKVGDITSVIIQALQASQRT